MRLAWIPLLLVACGGTDDDLLARLAGTWTGSFATDAGTFPATAELAWNDELLTGQIVVDEAPAHTYAVRRWSTAKDVAYLELTDVADGTRGLDVSGTVATTFAGDATLRYPCGAETCGWVGTFELTHAAGPLDTGSPPPTGGTGAR